MTLPKRDFFKEQKAKAEGEAMLGESVILHILFLKNMLKINRRKKRE